MSDTTKTVLEAFPATRPAIVRAVDLRVGDQVAEADGFLWTIAAVERSVTGKTVILTLTSDFSSFRSHWTGVRKPLRASSRVWAVRA